MDLISIPLHVTRSIFISISLLLSLSHPVHASLFIEINSQSFTDNLPIYRFANHLNSQYQPGKLAFTHNELVVGYSWSDYSLAVVERYDYVLHFNPDSLKLAYLSENKLPVEPDQLYQVKVDAAHTRSKGLRFGFKPPDFFGVHSEIKTSLLRGDYLLDGSANGTIETTNSNSYQGDLFVDYHYSKDLLLNRNITPPRAWGVTIDANFSGKLNLGKLNFGTIDSLQWQYEIKDMLAKWFWQSSPYTLADISSDTVDFDENGFINTRPVAQGILTTHSFQQSLPARHSLSAQLDLTKTFGLRSRIQYLNQEYFTEMGFSYLIAPQFQTTMLVDLKHSAGLIELKHHNTSIALQADNINWQDATSLHLQLKIRL